MPLDLATLPALAFAFVLLLGRVGAALTLLPGLGESEPPAMLRAGFAIAIALLLLPAIAPLVPAIPASIPTTAFMVAAEVVTGLWLGWLARLLTLSLPMAGQFISFMLGTTNVLVTDTELGTQASAIQQLFTLLAPLALLVTGLYALPLAALAGSYTLIPPGALLPVGDGTQLATRAVTDSFALALKLASPFVLAGVVWHVVIGLLARLVPRVPMYFVALPGQILGGLLLLAALGAIIIAAWHDAVGAGFAHLPGL